VTPRRLRIVAIAGTAVGGRWFVDQVTGLAQLGHTVLAVLPDEGPVSEALRAAGVACAVIRFKGKRLVDLPRVAFAQLQLIALLRSFRPDVVHYHLLKAILMGRIAALVARVPVRISQWPGDVHRSSRLFRWLDDGTAAIDTVIIGSCQSIADAYKHDGRRVAVGYYGLRTDEWQADLSAEARAMLRADLSLRAATPTVGMVAYMYPTRLPGFGATSFKGHETFIRAAAILARAGGDVQFLVVGDELLGGDGSYRRGLEAMAESLGLAGRIVFAGNRSDIQRVLQVMDVVAVPSTSESACYVAMEALLLERPVVASDVGGLPDTVVDGLGGLLVPPGDAVALAEAVGKLLRDPVLGHGLAGAGRLHVLEHFDLRTTTAAIEAIYRTAVLESQGRRAG